MGKILPVLLALIGVAAGVGAGLALRPDPAEVVDMHPCGDETEQKVSEKTEASNKKAPGDDAASREYVKLNNQFVVPVVTNDLVDSLVVMSLSVEVSQGQTQAVYSREPKLRDALLQVLFDHANIGGFEGEFTSAENMDILRSALSETAQGVVGDVVMGILITDIARQDV